MVSPVSVVRVSLWLHSLPLPVLPQHFLPTTQSAGSFFSLPRVSPPQSPSVPSGPSPLSLLVCLAQRKILLSLAWTHLLRVYGTAVLSAAFFLVAVVSLSSRARRRGRGPSCAVGWPCDSPTGTVRAQAGARAVHYLTKWSRCRGGRRGSGSGDTRKHRKKQAETRKDAQDTQKTQKRQRQKESRSPRAVDDEGRRWRACRTMHKRALFPVSCGVLRAGG